MPLTELQKTQAAYAYFTLEEWKIIERSVRKAQGYVCGIFVRDDENKVAAMLAKFPSAVL